MKYKRNLSNGMKNKQDLSNGLNKQVNKSYYFTKKYANLERFISYFYQIDLIRKSNAKNILFIGVGDGVVVDYLRKNPDLNITTFDIASDLNPDIVGNLNALPFQENKFDLIVAYEVLEHLPFDNFSKILSDLSRISKKNVIISIPFRNTNFELIIKFPFIRTLFKKDYFRVLLAFPIKFPGFKISGQHYWEMDNRQYRASKVYSLIKENFDIILEKKALLSSYKCFFVLKSKKNI